MKIYFATGNKGKLEEMRPLFQERGYELVQVDVDVPEIDSMDIEKVARRKVIDSFNEWDGEGMLIVEDTGFFVEAIGGFPGPEAALFAGTVGANGLLRLMEGKVNREAYFKTGIACYQGGKVNVFSGKMHGKVPGEKRGESHQYLPYNSYFIPEGEDKSLAEDRNLKDERFHRRKAVFKFLEWLD